MNASLNKFKISIVRINTGEESEMIIQAPFDLDNAKQIAEHLVNLSLFNIIEIVQVQSVVKIQILPFCLS